MVKLGLQITLLFGSLLPTASDSAKDDPRDAKVWNFTTYLRGTAPQLRDAINRESERFVKRKREILQELSSGIIDLEKREARALELLRASEKYMRTAADRDAAERALQAARASGTIEQRLDASSKFNTHRLAIERMEKDALASDYVQRARDRLVERENTLKEIEQSLEGTLAHRAKMVVVIRDSCTFEAPLIVGRRGVLRHVSVTSVAGTTVRGVHKLFVPVEKVGEAEQVVTIVGKAESVRVEITGINTSGLAPEKQYDILQAVELVAIEGGGAEGPLYRFRATPEDPLQRLMDLVVPVPGDKKSAPPE